MRHEPIEGLIVKMFKKTPRMALFFVGGIAVSASLLGAFLYSGSTPQSQAVSAHAPAVGGRPADLLLHDPTTGIPFLNRKYTAPKAPSPILAMPAEAMLIVKDEVLTLENESGPVATFPLTSMRAELRTVAATWLAQGPSPIRLGQVENVSPDNEVAGAVHAVLPHPGNADILYLGSVNGGVWKTTNATDEKPIWTPLTDTASSLSIGALAFDTSTSLYTTLWAGIGRNSSLSSFGGVRSGLMKSTDAGASWTSVTGGGTLVGKNISGLVAHGNTIVVSVNIADEFYYENIGIFRSIDGGSTFTQISGSTGTGLPAGAAFDLAQDPNNSSVLYTATKYASPDGVYRSADTGATWGKVSSSDMDSKITNDTSNIEISVGLNTSAVNAGILNNGQLRNGGIFQSPTGLADSWVAMDTPLTNEGGGSVGTNPTFKAQAGKPGGQGAIHFSILAGKNNSTQLYVGGDRQPAGFEDKGGFPNAIGADNYSGRLFRGDSSVTATGLAPSPQWKHLTHVSDAGSMTGGGTASGSSPHADSRDMAYNAAGDLIESDDGGIYLRSDPTNNEGDWISINGNLQITEQHNIAYDPVSNIIISGNQDTGTSQQSASGSLAWDTVSQADGGDVAVSVDPANSSQSVRYSSFQELGGFARRVYDAQGNRVDTVYPALNVEGGGDPHEPSFVNPVAVNQVDATRLLLGGQNGLYESANQGDTIVQVNTFATIFGAGNALVYGGRSSGVDNPDLIYAASCCTDDGVTIARRTTAGIDTVQIQGADTPRGVVADPEEWKTVFVTDPDQVFMSTNAGDAWTDITGDLVNSFGTLDIRGIEYVRIGARGALLVGTLNGVYVSFDEDYTQWSLLGSGLPNTQVFDMDFNLADDVLVAATQGRGAWKIEKVSEALGVTTEEPPPPQAVDPAVLWFMLKGSTTGDSDE